MITTPEQARKALQTLCVNGNAKELASVKTLVMFVNEVERMKLPQTPALFKPTKEHPFLTPVNAGD